MPIKLYVLMLLFLFVIIFRGSSAPSDMTGLTLYRRHVGTFMIKRHELQICHHFIFVLFLYFFLSLFLPYKGLVSTVKVLILKFGIEDFIDPGLLKIRLTLITGLSLRFCLHKCLGTLTWSEHATPILGLCHAVSPTGLVR